MKATFLGCLTADGRREERVGLTVGGVYEIISKLGRASGGLRFVLRDDDGDLRHRPGSDFEVVR